MSSDPEKSENAAENTESTEGGYDRMAKLMADVPDLAIYRRFTYLSAESLLHYQAQIRDIEMVLDEIQKEDRAAPPNTDRSRHAFDSYLLRRSVMNGREVDGEDGSRQWRTIVEMRGLIKEYYEAMILHHQVVNLDKPHQGQVDALKTWMRRPSMGNMNLIGVDHSIWAESKLDELVTLARSTPDGATSAMSTRLVKMYHGILGRHIHDVAVTQGDHLQNSIVYGSRVQLVVRGIKALGACMLPIVGIIVLDAVKDMRSRLGIIAAFTAVFSLTMCYTTPASVKDIFSATAAFSAVLVVFVGTTGTTDNGSSLAVG